MVEFPTVDLTSCAREPIHIPGRIQSFGALVAVTADWLIAHRSANLGEFLGLARQPEPGEALTGCIGIDLIDTFRQRLQQIHGNDGLERLFGVQPLAGGALFDVAMHVSGRLIVIEWERHGAESPDRHFGLLRPMTSRLEQTQSVEALCDAAARQLRLLLGFDRVMVYKFHADDTGEVVAEARLPELDSFFGLRYPASDIPPQARALYLRNILRIISDVDDPTVAVEPTIGPAGEPLDMSLGTLRAVSPIHIEYLRNMGVGASMSISIILRGKLWGLFACHHYSPRVLDYALRTTSELFAQMFALLLDQQIGDRQREDIRLGQELHDRLMAQISESRGLLENFDRLVPLLGQVIAHDGVSLFVEGEYVAQGTAPTREQFLAMVPFLNTIATSSVFATDSLQRQLPAAAAFAAIAPGALVIPVSRRPRDYIVLWRRELVHAVRWAGNPEKPVEYGPNGARLTPRKSFEAWQQVVKGTSAAWSDENLRSAEALRITLLEVILRITDNAMQERARAQQQQELLIAELNHRVRNILNLIRGLVNQSRHEAIDIADFTDLVAGRIDALALAHDNITRNHWGETSLRELLDSEARAYLSNKADRVMVLGSDVLVAPEAYAVLALVVHELMTNSAKYGSLCDRHGMLEIGLSRTAVGELAIAWRERGGPPVRFPARKGFGTTIIERSIPYELKGAAVVRYKVSGVEADFVIPARYIKDAPEGEHVKAKDPSGDDAAQQAPAPAGAGLPANVLVLEDNMIIALDAEETLLELGVTRVQLASSNDAALAILRSDAPDFALLDFNLGSETSEPTARALAQAGIPFAFATGYGEIDGLSGGALHKVPVIQKPYSKADLENAMAQASET
ncbi:HWE histidine kinase domain-containing protein [Novosphingobium lentum]|uniref:HWE histidine kinase domain-containing protein n=1 Tax=Novosphingobium lentum TaxID=145287 RepID=UPI0008341405|nr:HWE histidine kinase domain-containing protein [Novosphingobium lentum]